MKTWPILLLFFVFFQASANNLPALNPTKSSPHKLFLTSESQAEDSFDVWNIDGGYAYQLFDSFDLYVGARVNNSQNTSQNGFLSGISYQVTDRVMVKSTIRSFKNTLENKSDQNSNFAAEVTSRVKINEQIDLHATLDFQEWQQGIEFGLGFRF
ncbi:ribonuclease regulator [Vibrio sp. IRLE0018]|uniref:ribonuclease regulator n=1 Tax=Vibrio floridensis TaxID=2908007 RepID=UPI001F1E5D57|nr:ribonuclease regulator [Vibrio floridensis]MCF8779786.1 ribonuclease regulator [Vibrio floridensis]